VTWSDEPPSEDGIYYLKIQEGEWTVGELSNGEWQNVGETERWPHAAFYVFGPRIPTPDELEAMAAMRSALLRIRHLQRNKNATIGDAITIAKLAIGTQAKKGGDA